MNRPLTPSLSPSDGERVAEGRVRGGSWSQCMRKSERGLSMNLTSVGTSRCDVLARESAGGIVAPLNAARTAQRAAPTRFRGSMREVLFRVGLSMNRASCGSQTRGPDRASVRRSGSWSQCVRKSEWRLSMNRPSPGLRPPSPRLAGRGQGEGCQSGSWSQCVRKSARRLSMNLREWHRHLACSGPDRLEACPTLQPAARFMAPTHVQNWRSMLIVTRISSRQKRPAPKPPRQQTKRA